MKRWFAVGVAAVLALTTVAGAEAGGKKVKFPKPERVTDRKAFDVRGALKHTKQEEKWAAPDRGRDPAVVKLRPPHDLPHNLKID